MLGKKSVSVGSTHRLFVKGIHVRHTVSVTTGVWERQKMTLLRKLQNGPSTPILEKSFTVMGHVFVSCKLDQTDSYCEKCCTRIWDFVNLGPNQYYTCDSELPHRNAFAELKHICLSGSEI